MPMLLLLGLLGFGAQAVNSSLGMGYGVSSTTALLALGTSPALASATVNLSQVGSQLVSGLAHWRFGNVDWRIVWRIGLPGAVGAFAGATFLSWLSTAAAAPLMAGILLLLGGYLLVRFTARGTPQEHLGKPLRSTFLAPLGLIGGFLNSTGGGGSGPVITTALLASGRAEPRTVVGSISASEFAVVTAGSAGFLVGLGLGGINLAWVGVMLAGGVVAAPAAAWLTRHLPARMFGSVVGGLIVITNAHTLLRLDGLAVPVPAASATLAVLGLVWAGAVGWSARPGPNRAPRLKLELEPERPLGNEPAPVRAAAPRRR